MDNKEKRTIDKLIGNDTGKGMENERINIPKNKSMLDLWNDYIETNKKLCVLKEEGS